MNSRDHLTELAFAVAPELESAPFHILTHRPEWHDVHGALAYVIRGRIQFVKDELIRLGEWEGQWGNTIVFTPGLAEESILPILLHELAHLLPAKPAIVDTIQPTQEQVAGQNLQIAAWAAGSREVPPWAGHGPDFIRAAIHLSHRAEKLGWNIPLESMNVAGEPYGLSMPFNYKVELGTEPWEFERKTFAEIDAAPMPPRFLNLFVQDAMYHHHSQVLTEVQKWLPKPLQHQL